MYKQGDIIFVNFNPVSGHEEGKERPALVVSNETFNEQTKMALLCPISHAKDFPLHIDLPSGLKTDGKVLCEHLRSMDISARGYRVLEKVPNDFLQTVLTYCKWTM